MDKTKSIRQTAEELSDEEFSANIDKIIFGRYGQDSKTETVEAVPEPETKAEPEPNIEPTKEEIEEQPDEPASVIPFPLPPKEKMELEAPKSMPEIKTIEGSRNTEPCPYCQKTFDGEGYSFGTDFGDTEPSVSIYIRKHETVYDLVIESENGSTACRITYCPKCGRYLDGGV